MAFAVGFNPSRPHTQHREALDSSQAEPLTPELQSLSSTSKVQNKANAAVLKSMPSFLKAYDECDTENPMMSVWNELRAEHALIDA